MKQFWVSWYAPMAEFSQFEWHGPWWISGETFDGRFTACAAVCAESSEAAKSAIVAAYDSPRELEWRFANERPDDWDPFSSDRFARAKWMKWPWTPEQNAEARLGEPAQCPNCGWSEGNADCPACRDKARI